MSSTRHGTNQSASVSNYYVTPIETITAFMEAWQGWRNLESIAALDPCAGGSENTPMSYHSALSSLGIVNIDTMDNRPDSPAAMKQDYLQAKVAGQYNLIISNPPFSLATAFVDRALEDVVRGGFVVMLLRLNIFGSKKRREWWQLHMPVEAYVHSHRPSFSGGRGHDSIEYMHAVWQKGTSPEFTALRVI